MGMLHVTENDLRAATTAIYGLQPEHAPTQVWVDHFDDTHSYVRAMYQSEFCKRCARQLLRLVAALRIMDGEEPEITIVIYLGGDGDKISDERQKFVRNRLAGFKRPG